jgi:hypothetical protein
LVEEVMALEGQKAPGQRALLLHHLGHGDGGVVIGDPHRHRPEEFEARHVRRLEALGALAGIGGEDVRVRVRQRDHTQRSFYPLAGDLDGGLAEGELGVSGWMRRRDERFLGVRLGVLHRRLHLGVTPRVAVLVAQAVEDASRRVPLFGRGRLVVGQDPVDRGQMSPEHRLPADLSHLIAGRLCVGQDLGQGLMANPIVTVDRTLRRAFHQDLPSNLGPLVHVGVHPSPVLLVCPGPKALERDRTDPGLLRCCRFRS